jgi:hypothetical protein
MRRVFHFVLWQVTKLFNGGLQKVAQMTVQEYEAEKIRAEEKKLKLEQRKVLLSIPINLYLQQVH